VVGDFDPDALLTVLGEALAEWQGASGRTKPVPAPPMQTAETGWQLVPRPNSVQSHLMLGTLCPPRDAPDSLALQLAVSLLGSGASSRMFLTVREQYGYAYSVGAHLDYYLRVGAFVAEAQTATENTHDAIRQIRAEAERLINEPIPTDELQATQNYMIGRHMLGRITLGGVADLYKQAVIYGLPLDYWQRYPETAGVADGAAGASSGGTVFAARPFRDRRGRRTELGRGVFVAAPFPLQRERRR
jgi:zinc protease